MNHGVEGLCAKTLAEDVSDVRGERRSRIEFRQQDVRGLERQRHLLPQTGDGVQQLAQPFEREVPYVDGNEQLGTGHERRLRPEA
jgi:hypothetical protein